MSGANDLLARLMRDVPYLSMMGFEFSLEDGDLRAVMPYREDLIGNPSLPALHGGAIASFLESTALMALGCARIWTDDTAPAQGAVWPATPKTIDLTIDFMRSGRPQDAYASARITRAGRRFATVHSSAWQDERERPIAEAMVHFLMPADG